jgi:hypothetical protein
MKVVHPGTELDCMAVTTSLDAWDIVALRFGVAGLLLSPVLVQRGLARDRLGWPGLVVIIAGTGAPFLGASGGAAFGALVPALSALLAIPLLDEWPTKTDWIGIVLISAGVHLANGGPLPGRKPEPLSRPRSILRQRCRLRGRRCLALRSNPFEGGQSSTRRGKP